MELHEHLMERYDEELEDALEYAELADKAKKAGHHYLSVGLRMIGSEEMTHARFLCERLKAHGFTFTNEQKEKKEKAEAKYN
jgi:rubrerythrin